MFIKYFDLLSPNITFYYKGYLSHNSIVSGIISIISILIIINLAIYFSLEIFEKADPSAFYYNIFIEDAGIYKISTSSFFHFLSFSTIRSKETQETFDLKKFNVIGYNSNYNKFLGNSKKNSKGMYFDNHWLYGYCDKKKNTYEIDNLLEDDLLQKSICIKKFYNASEEKYYDIDDKEFIWPEIAHGALQKNNKIYSIIVQKCENKTLQKLLGEGYECENQEEIDKYFNTSGTKLLYLYFINNGMNALNYTNPIQKSFYKIYTSFSQSHYTGNDISFHPSKIITDDGLVVKNIEEKISYTFSRNDAFINSNENYKNVYITYGFFLKNIMEYYERKYIRIQDVISNIGGFNQVIFIVATYINSLYNYFVTLSDTENILTSLIYIEKSIHKNESDKLKNSKNKMKDIEKQKNLENHIKSKNERKKNKTDSNNKFKNSNNKIENNISTDNSISKANFKSLNRELKTMKNKDFQNFIL